MAIEIRRVPIDELGPWVEALSTTFLDRIDTAKFVAAVAPIWDFERVWGAFDGQFVGTLRTWATELTVPGGATLPTSAVAAVTVLRTHRRRGVLRSMVAAEHEAARSRGEVLAALYASETGIYGRFGYGPAVRSCIWTLDTRSTSMLRGTPDPVDFAPIEQASADLCREVYERFRRSRTGELGRRDVTFAAGLGLIDPAWGPPWKGWLAVHREASGRPDGYVRYSAEEKWEDRQPRSVVEVQDLVALDDAAYDDLWRFLADMDWVGKVRTERRSPDERLPWLLSNQRAAVQSEAGDSLWVALLDIPAALAARTYERPGDMVLEVVGAEPDGGRARFRLEAGPDGSACRRTDGDPDLTLHADALGAAYLGGTPLRHAVARHGHEEHRPGALAAADALFRTLEPPTCMTFF